MAHFLNAFMSFLGYILALIVVIIAYRLYKRVKAPVWAWQQYIRVLIDDEEYEEAKRITKLIDSKDRYAKIRTPKGYKVRRKQNLDLADRYEAMTFVINQSYVFTCKKDNYKKGFEIKDKD